MTSRSGETRALFVRGGALGDFLLSLPALQALRALWRGGFMEVMAARAPARLALACGLVDAVRDLQGADAARLFATQPRLPAELASRLSGFDAVVCYLHDPDGVVREHLVRCCRGRLILASPLVRGGHAVDHFLRPLRDFGIEVTGSETPRLDLPAGLVEEGRRRLAAERPVLVMHPGSGSPRKNWPLSSFVELARQAARSGLVEPVFLAGEADGAAVEELTALGSPFRLFSNLALEQAAGLLATAAGYVGNDSGISHLAAAVGLPVAALFGPTDPAVWAPRGNVAVLRPPRGAPLDRLGVEEVWSAVSGMVR